MKLFHTSLLAVMIAVAVLCPATVAAEIDSIAESVSYTIDFPINRHTVDPAFSHNGQALDSLRATIDAIRGDSLVGLEKISVEGYASPDGRVSRNLALAQRRTDALARWLVEKCGVEPELVHRQQSAIAWDDFRREISESGLPQSSRILEICANGSDSSQADVWRRMARLRTLDGGRVWKTLTRDIFPGLRRSVSVLVMVRRVIPEPEILPESEPGEDASVMTAGEAAVLSSMADGNCIDN